MSQSLPLAALGMAPPSHAVADLPWSLGVRLSQSLPSAPRANRYTCAKGRPSADAARNRGERREARDEYAAIRELRDRTWIAANVNAG